MFVSQPSLFQSTGNHWYQDGIDAAARVELPRTLLKIFLSMRRDQIRSHETCIVIRFAAFYSCTSESTGRVW